MHDIRLQRDSSSTLNSKSSGKSRETSAVHVGDVVALCNYALRVAVAVLFIRDPLKVLGLVHRLLCSPPLIVESSEVTVLNRSFGPTLRHVAMVMPILSAGSQRNSSAGSASNGEASKTILAVLIRGPRTARELCHRAIHASSLSDFSKTLRARLPFNIPFAISPLKFPVVPNASSRTSQTLNNGIVKLRV